MKRGANSAMRDERRKEAFLEAFVELRGDLDAARDAVRITRTTFYTWLRTDEVFRARFDQYRMALAEEIENEAIRRVLNPTGARGSDALAVTLLKGLKKERYAEQAQQSTNQVIVYVSSLRETPRPGVQSGGLEVEVSGPTGADQSGAGVPAPAGVRALARGDEPGGPRGDSPEDEDAGGGGAAGA